MSVNVVGISAYYHDSACAVLRDGRLVAAASEERFSRRKYDAAIPQYAFKYCLREAGLTAADLDGIAYYEDPEEKLARQLWMLPGMLNDAQVLERLDPRRPHRDIREVLGCECPIHVVKHHHAHAASSFYCSGFSHAAILTVDGVGEWTTTAFGRASVEAGMELLDEVQFPHSLGLFYSALTSYLGFAVNDGEYKVMGLAPYGRPRYVEQLERLITLLPGAQYRLDLDYFDFGSQERMYTDRLAALLGQPPRARGADIEPFHEDVARSMQLLLERVLIAKAHELHARVPADALCMAGGVALNCVANSAILKHAPFRRLFVQPAAGDAGGAIGAAALAHLAIAGRSLPLEPIADMALGPAYTHAEIRALLEAMEVEAIDHAGREDRLLADVADRLTSGQVVGWFQGRMEFGPRALGYRSILADPRDPGMRDRINALVKKREAFRPFAPAVLWSKAREHFDLDHPSPFMLETCQVRSALELPAITHVDGSARVQTVHESTNPRFAALLRHFERRTGCPMLLNTSFNMKDEPIVCTPVDAMISFVRSNLDALAMGDFLIERTTLGPLRRRLIDAEMPLHPSAVTRKIYTLV